MQNPGKLAVCGVALPSRFGAVSGLDCREDLQEDQLLAQHCERFVILSALLC